MVLKNIRIWTRHGQIERGYIVTQGSKIADIGLMKHYIDTGDEVLDAAGYTAYPGFIDGHCHLGLFGDSLGFEGEDGNEDTDPCTPQLRAIDAINPQDRGFAEALAAGVTTVITGPGSANAIGGQFCALKTHGRFVEEMLVRAPVAMKMALGENPKSTYNEKAQAPTTRMATAAVIREQLFKAQRYQADLVRASEEDGDEPEFDIKCQALLPVLSQKLPVHIHAHRADDIATAVRICREFNLRYVLVHATEGHRLADYLAEQQASVVCGPVINHRSKPELAGFTLGNAAALARQGGAVSICTDHPEIPVDFLAISAGLCVREGLPFDKAMEGITYIPALQSGIADRVGSIEKGLDADILLFRGNPLTLEAKPALVMINGEIVHNNLTK